MPLPNSFFHQPLRLKLSRDLLRNARPSLRRVFTRGSDTGPANSLVLLLLIGTLKTPKCRAWADLLPEDPGLDPPRQYSEALVAHEGALWDSKDIVELLKSPLLRLRDEEEDHNKRDDVETSVQTERTGRCERGEHAGEGN